MLFNAELGPGSGCWGCASGVVVGGVVVVGTVIMAAVDTGASASVVVTEIADVVVEGSAVAGVLVVSCPIRW